MPQPESSASYTPSEIRERVLPLMTNRHLEGAKGGTTSGTTVDTIGGAISTVTRSIAKSDGEDIVVSLVIPGETDEFQHLADEQLASAFASTDEAIEGSLGNLAKIVTETGLTIERLEVENIDLNVWSVEFRRGTHLPFVASLLLLSDSIKTLERKIEAKGEMLACVPARNRLLICGATDDAAVCEMALLAGFMKEQSLAPLSNLVWILKDGNVAGHKFIKLEVTASGPNLIEPGIDLL